MIWIQAALVFIFALTNDWIAVSWHQAVEKNQPVKGAVAASFIGIIAWLSIIWVVVHNYWLIVPDVMGTAIGTYVGIKHQHRKKVIKATPAGILLNFLNYR